MNFVGAIHMQSLLARIMPEGTTGNHLSAPDCIS